MTLGRPVLALPGAASTIFKDFGMSRPGLEPATSRSRSGISSNWATGAGQVQCTEQFTIRLLSYCYLPYRALLTWKIDKAMGQGADLIHW